MNFKKYHVSRNLWNFYPEQTIVGVTLSWDGEKISYSGTCKSPQNITMNINLKAGTYVLKANANRIPTNDDASCIDIYRASPFFMVKIENSDAVNGTKTFTIAEDMNAVLRIRVANGVNYDGFEIRPMFNTGSQPLPYEPYSSEVWHDIPHYIHNTSTDTITTLPAVLYPNDTTATVGLKGQTVQSGTSTPDNPIMPQGTGEKTGNLLPLSDKTFTITAFGSNFTVSCSGGNLYFSGNITEIPSNYTAWKTNFAFELEAGTYYCNAPSPLGSNFGRYIKKYDDDSIIINSNTYIFTLTEKTKCYLAFYIYQKSVDSKIELMLNTGSTALPYEPFGVKIPISSANTTTPVYLGQVESTRQIKQLVLTGEEGWQRQSGEHTTCINLYMPISLAMPSGLIASNVVTYNSSAGGGNDTLINVGKINYTGTNLLVDLSASEFSSANAWKYYLQQQYAAGTPVCVWYVLANPETAVVNEPLMRIGDYADTLSNIPIPVTAGGDTLSVGTTVQPSEVTVNYKGWHPVQNVHERESGEWT